MKKLKLKTWVKYTILAIVNLVIILNLPLIIRQGNTLNDYRFNILAITVFIIMNAIAVLQIEKN